MTAAAKDLDRSGVVDALRGLAAGSVIAYHTSGLPGAQIPASGVGHAAYRNLDAALMIFFLISGYGISRPFVVAVVDGRPIPDLARYALRRACRILPAFWICLLFVILVVHGSPRQIGAGPLQHWWQVPLHGLLLQDVVPGQIQQLIKVSWTLGNELFFYVLVPVAALLIARRWPGGISPSRLARLVMVVWAGSAVLLVAADQLPAYTDGAATARYSFPAMFGFFCPGILVAIATTRTARAAGGPWARVHRLWSKPWHWGLVTLALVGLAVAVRQGELALGARHPLFLDQHWELYAVAWAVMLGGLLAAGPVLDRATRPLALLGLVSYGAYLWHTVIIRGLAGAGLYFTTSRVGIAALPLNIALLLGLTLPIAIASWVFVERPLLHWASAWRRRPAAQPALAEPAATDPAAETASARIVVG